MGLTPLQVEIVVNDGPFRAALAHALKLVEQHGPLLLQIEQRLRARRAHVLYRHRHRGKW